jgi:Ion channel
LPRCDTGGKGRRQKWSEGMTLTNLLLGLPMTLLCLVVQVLTAYWAVRNYARRTERAGRPVTLVAGAVPLMNAMLVMMLGNFLQIVLWGVLFVALGEFSELYEAIYHSAVNYASLGYGDIVMSAPWKMLGPLEALNGVVMLGMTGAAVMAILQQMYREQHDMSRGTLDDRADPPR